MPTATEKSSSSSSFVDYLVLPAIVFAQFAGTSLWFAPNAVVSSIDGFGKSETSALVSSVQAGFIVGTLSLTYFAATDRISPPFLFAVFGIVGAILNALCITNTIFGVWIVLRILVGVCLAGIYPVGMKIAAMEYPNGLGARLGVLIAALTLGTAFPWLVRGIGGQKLPVAATLGSVSALAVVGALVMAVIMIPRHGGRGSQHYVRLLSLCGCRGKGPVPPASLESEHTLEKEQVLDETKPEQQQPTTYVQSPEDEELCEEIGDAANHLSSSHSASDSSISPKEEEPLMGLQALRAMWSDSQFRAAAWGYFGHMWELYAFWAHVPSLISSHNTIYNGGVLNVELTAFLTIAIGAVSCTVGGLWSLVAGRHVLPGSAVVAEVTLFASGVCCYLAPVYQSMSQGVFFFYLLVWGSAVIADSGQFSSLAAEFAAKGLVGTSLTLTTCIGFTITIVSIQLVDALIENGWDPGNALALLAIGPTLGVLRTYVEWPLHRLLFCGTAQSRVVKERGYENGRFDPEDLAEHDKAP